MDSSFSGFKDINFASVLNLETIFVYVFVILSYWGCMINSPSLDSGLFQAITFRAKPVFLSRFLLLKPDTDAAMTE